MAIFRKIKESYYNILDQLSPPPKKKKIMKPPFLTPPWSLAPFLFTRSLNRKQKTKYQRVEFSWQDNCKNYVWWSPNVQKSPLGSSILGEMCVKIVLWCIYAHTLTGEFILCNFGTFSKELLLRKLKTSDKNVACSSKCILKT